MERCIVAPVDGSEFGEHALPLAATLAKRTGAVLHVVHVHTAPFPASGIETAAFGGAWSEMAKRQEREYLEALVQRIADRYGIRAGSSLIEGPVAAALERYIAECEAGLAVMSTHAHTRLSRIWHHGVAEHVAQHLPIPVLLVHPAEGEAPDLGSEPEIGRILIPLDGSEQAESMVDRAVELGRQLGARYLLLRVVRPEVELGFTLLAQDGHVNHHRLMQDRAAAEQYLDSVAERLRAEGLEVATQVEVAEDPVAAIVALARAQADLIAMESHPPNAVARLLGANTADRVLQDAPVPVLLSAGPLPPADGAPGPIEAPFPGA